MTASTRPGPQPPDGGVCGWVLARPSSHTFLTVGLEHPERVRRQWAHGVPRRPPSAKRPGDQSNPVVRGTRLRSSQGRDETSYLRSGNRPPDGLVAFRHSIGRSWGSSPGSVSSRRRWRRSIRVGPFGRVRLQASSRLWSCSCGRRPSANVSVPGASGAPPRRARMTMTQDERGG